MTPNDPNTPEAFVFFKDISCSSPIIDLLVNEFHNVIMDLWDNHALLITRTVRCRPNAPWYTDELRDMKTRITKT